MKISPRNLPKRTPLKSNKYIEALFNPLPRSQQEERKNYEGKPKPSADSGLISVFADDERDAAPKKKTPNHHPKAPHE